MGPEPDQARLGEDGPVKDDAQSGLPSVSLSWTRTVVPFFTRSVLSNKASHTTEPMPLENSLPGVPMTPSH